MKREYDTTTNGILLVDKPQGITSHDVVYRLRRWFNFKKVGHTGTLDPMATGLLVMLIGRKMTRRSVELSDSDKEYEAVFKFGIKTDSGDAVGNILEEKKPDIKKEDILALMDEFRGEILQTPPMFSAKKYKGKKLYEYARKGQEVKVPPKKVTIHFFEMLDCSLPEARFVINCSKGTFIRQLAVDLGDRLACGAHLSALRRTKAGEYSIENSYALEKLKETLKEDFLKLLINDEKN